MQRESWTWASAHLSAPARVARWGHYGTPVLLYPTAGGDFEEIERFHLIGALRELLQNGRIKVFSVDGVAARTWLRGTETPERCIDVQNAYDAYIDNEVVPLIRRDCASETLEIIVAGAAIGAHNAVASLCRLPRVFRVAIALSGIFDLSKYLTSGFTPALAAVSPLHSLRAGARGQSAQDLRRRFVMLATGEGDYESPSESAQMGQALNAAGVPYTLELWGRHFAHSWNTWREMLPRYLAAHS
jgi:esterase/lipase superfamily enzyme